MNRLISKFKYWVKTVLWVLTGYLGSPITLATPHTVTVLITYFNPVRMRNINHQIRNTLQCSFVERLIISNHNPDVNIQDFIKIKDSRITVVNQPAKRGCGYRWLVAKDFSFEHLIVIDDDILLSPVQLTQLFKHLIAQPDIPHGLSGMNCVPTGGFEFHDRHEMDVDFLCEVYAVTRHQLMRYMDVASRISSDETIAQSLEMTTDFMVISQMGAARPRIHEVGRLFRDETFKMEGVAVHKGPEFDQRVEHVLQTLQKLGLMNQ